MKKGGMNSTLVNTINQGKQFIILAVILEILTLVRILPLRARAETSKMIWNIMVGSKISFVYDTGKDKIQRVMVI